MTEQAPEIVAHADLSPASPKPIHTTSTSPALIPSLQDRADTLDVAYLDSLVPPAFPFVTMPAAPKPASSNEDETMEVADTIVVGGEDYSNEDEDDYELSDDDADVDDESLDAYGEEEEDSAEQEDQSTTVDASAQDQNMDVVESGNGDGAPATTSGSKEETKETTTTQPDEADVSETSSISLISDSPPSSEPDTLMKSASPVAHPSAVNTPSSRNPPQTEDESTQEQQQRSPSATVALSSASPAQAAAGESASAPDAASEEQENSTNGGTIDLQKLVDDITARAAEGSSDTTSAKPDSILSSSHNSLPTAQPAAAPAPSLTIPPSSSLPAKPAVAQQPGQSGPRPEDFHPFSSRGHNNSHAPPSLPGHSATTGNGIPNGGVYMAGAPGTTTESMSSLPPHPHHSGFNGSQTSHSSAQAIPGPDGLQGAQLQQAWDAFQADEKRYMTEAKWERFPDNSRIFIGESLQSPAANWCQSNRYVTGNLSSERVPKKEVFDLFHRYGRLAQISLKSAYGFVQYHSAEDAQRAMAGAQGAELGGRKIRTSNAIPRAKRRRRKGLTTTTDLEFSKTQKKREPNEQRDHSPDRRGIRGGERGGRGGLDRYEARDRGPRGRDDYRPGRSPSPRRDDGYGRDRYQYGAFDHASRGRSRSPNRFGRHDQGSYRRRSPSPQRRGPPEPELDIPRRYGDQVPDVQIIVLGEVDRNFVEWLQQTFFSRGLKPDAMFFNPRFSRDLLLQRHVLEGVHGVVELDITAQHKGKIPLRVFDRSAGINNVRFDQYQDLDPVVAAEVVLRAKHTQAPPQPAYPPNPYPPQHMYPPQHGVPPAGYPGYPQVPAAAPQPPQHGLSAQDIAGMAGQIDNATLQALLASLGPGAGGAQPQQQQHPGQPQIDVSALLGSINQGAAPTPVPGAMPGYGYNAAYPPPAAHGHPAAQVPSGGNDAVNDIMATLARYR